MAITQRTWTQLLALLAILFAVLNAINAVNKGGDAAVFFEGGRRFLHAQPLYERSSAADGFIGPPFQALFFAPFAAIAGWQPMAAKLVWHALNVGCLAIGVWFSLRACDAADLSRRPWLPMLFAPLLAILLPAQTNFEHQNMNALLLALIAGATWHVTAGSAVAAGILVGTATALKAFPVILIAYLAIRRHWIAAIAATATAAVLSLLPAVVYGASGFADLVQDFVRLGNSGWPIRVNNQSLIAVTDRLLISGIGANAQGVHTFSDAGPFVAGFWIVAMALGVAMLAPLVSTPRRRANVPAELAAVTTAAILISPIAWDHYWLLMLPGFLIVYNATDRRALGPAARYAFWAAALLTTGLSPLTLGSSGFNVARGLGSYTFAAVILFVALIVLCHRLSRSDRDAAAA
jgi:hypothetical protein